MAALAASAKTRSLSEGIATLLVGRASGFALGIVSSVVIARALGPEGRGVVGIVASTGGLLAIVAELGIGIAYLSDRTESRARAALLLSFLCPTLVVGLFVASVPLLVRWIPGAPPLLLVIGASVAIPSVILSTSRMIATGHNWLRFTATTDFSLQAATLSASAVALFVLHGGVPGVIIAQGLSTLLVTVVTCVLIVWLTKLRLLLPPRELVRDTLSKGAKVQLGTIALFVCYRGDLYIVNHYIGGSAVGHYSLALSLSEMARVVPEVLFFAIMGRDQAHTQNDSVADTATLCRQVIAGGAAALVVMAIAGPFVIPLVYGVKFRGAVAPFLALLPGLLALAASYSIAPLIVRRGWLAANSSCAFGAAVLMIALDLAVVPRWGILGAGVVSSFAYASLAAAQMVLVSRRTGAPLLSFLPVPQRMRGA